MARHKQMKRLDEQIFWVDGSGGTELDVRRGLEQNGQHGEY